MPPRPHPDALAPTPLDPPGHEFPLPHSTPAPEPDPTTVAQREGDGTDVGLLARKIALAGVSNMTAALFTNPADLVKVRQQLQLKSVSKTGAETRRSTNAFRTLVSMVRAEGLGSIYKGLTGSLLREGSYSGVRMGGYDLVKSTLVRSGIPGVADNPNGFGTKLSAGMVSGMVGAAIANPADLLKVRMQAPSATGTLRDHFSDIMRTKGVKGLYKAVFPTMIRAGILTSTQLGTYDQVKHMLKRDFPSHFREGFQTHLVASAIAGFCCSAASNPVDVVKVRMMTDKTGRYSNAFHCAALLLKNEGPLSFMKGFSMCFARLWPHSLVSLVVFEQLRKAVGMEAI